MVTNHYFEDRCPTLMIPTMVLQIYVIDHSPIQYFDKRVVSGKSGKGAGTYSFPVYFVPKFYYL